MAQDARNEPPMSLPAAKIIAEIESYASERFDSEHDDIETRLDELQAMQDEAADGIRHLERVLKERRQQPQTGSLSGEGLTDAERNA